MAARTIKVFIASPGDLAVERRAFKDTVDALNKGFGRGAGVVFVPLGWEDALSQVGRRSQSVINQDIDACDLFVLVMFRRWGQEAPDAAPYSSYTEEEFYRALTRREKKEADGTRKPEICVFFKHIDPSFMTDPGEQLKKVLAFRRKLEETKSALYRPFAKDEEFVSEVSEHLIAFAEGRLSSLDDDRTTPMIPDSLLGEIDKHKADAQRAMTELAAMSAEKQRALEEAEKARAMAKDATTRAEAAESVAEARAAQRSLALAESAAKAALEGKIEQARQEFAKALDGTTNIDVLFLGCDFFSRIGELDESERLLRRWLSISGPDSKNQDTANAYNNLGNIEIDRGNVKMAEAYYKKAMLTYEQIGDTVNKAAVYGNLGNLELEKNNVDAAEEYYKRALEIDEKHGNQMGVARHLGSLGNIESEKNHLKAADSYFKQAISIDKELGNQFGLAQHYHNMGYIAEKRGDSGEARRLWTLARDGFRMFGAKLRQEESQRLLDGLG